MPNFNQTGPQGEGPMTGRQQGRCRQSATQQAASDGAADSNNPENTNNFFPRRGQGFGRGNGHGGRGRGLGRQNRFRGN